MTAAAFGHGAFDAAPNLTETFSQIEGTARMIDNDDAQKIAKEVAGAVATTLRAQFELAKPVEVRHDFNGFGKLALRVGGAVILLLLSIVGSLVAYVWLAMGSDMKELEAVARSAAHEVQAQQIVRDDKQDAALRDIAKDVREVGDGVTRYGERIEALVEVGRDRDRRLQRLEDHDDIERHRVEPKR